MVNKVRAPPTTVGSLLYKQWRPYLEFYHAHSMKFYAIMLAKTVLIMLLNSDHLEKFQWLDCWLPGRLIYGTRITQASRYLAIPSWLLFMCNKILVDRMGDQFNIFCLEVGCFNYEHINSLVSCLPHWPRGLLSKAPLDETQYRHPVLCEFFPSPLDKRQLIQRPTQTSQMRKLYGKLHLFVLIFFIASSISVLSILIVTHGPLMLTRRGFELTRENCVHFIIRRAASISGNSSENQNSVYKFIYEADFRNLSSIYEHRSNPIVLPYDQLLTLNWYQTSRFLCDLVENLLVWPSLFIIYWYNVYYTVLFSLQVIVYARDLRRRLENLIHKLRLSNGYIQVILIPPNDALAASPIYRSNIRSASARLGLNEIERLQASLFDYFSLVSFYNPFVGLTTLINLTLWLIYSFFIFVRAVKLDRFSNVRALDYGVQTEFFLIFAGCMVIALVFLVAGALVHSNSNKLYPPLNQIVALDRSLLSTRKRWLALLDRFEPNKLHCFTIFGHTTLSWLFILKLFWWVVSALVILISK